MCKYVQVGPGLSLGGDRVQVGVGSFKIILYSLHVGVKYTLESTGFIQSIPNLEILSSKNFNPYTTL